MWERDKLTNILNEKKKREEKFKFKDLALGLIFSKENQQLKMEYEKEIIC